MESEKQSALAKSILVPSVQELANGCILKVPDRYVRLDQHPPISTDYNNADQIPIIKMDYLLQGSDDELHKLHSACQEWGFFQLINHGVSYSLMDNLKLETKEFFNLPLQQKRKYWQTPDDVQGFGQAFVISEDQKLDWSDLFYFNTLPKTNRKSQLFSILPNPYRDTLERYSTQLFELSGKILDSMAKALEIDIEAMRSVFGEGRQTMRMNYYPPCPEPKKVIGLTPHSDASALTILLQLNQTEGLQIWKDGNWVSVKPVPNAFIINVGDTLEIVSNGIYRSILHRAIVNANNERLSVATFYGPSMDMEIGPIPSLITPQAPAKFKRINVTDYMKGFFSRALDGKSNLERMKIDETSS